MRRTISATAAGAASVLALAVLSGCVHVSGCPGWVSFDTPADAAEDADAVVSGRVSGHSGTTPMFGATANVWNVEVVEWLKGDGPAAIEVISPPESCSDPAYFGADPFEEPSQGETVVVFLTAESGRWRAVTPLQGIIPAAPDGGLPENWP